MQAEILEAFGQAGVELLKESVRPYSASGKTVNSIGYEATPTSLKIFARPFFSAIETGRGPRKNSAYQGFDKSMLDYMDSRNIGVGLPEKKRQQLARFLSYKINKEGDRLFKSGGREVYSVKLQMFVDQLIEALKKDFAKYFLTSLKFSLNGTVSNSSSQG